MGARPSLARHLLSSDRMDEADPGIAAEAVRLALPTERLAASEALADWLAHEVRNPLNCASLQLEVLKRCLEPPGCESEALKPVVELIEQALQRLDLVFNDVLSLLQPPAAGEVPKQRA
jgi:signal transduction histidine kinase